MASKEPAPTRRHNRRALRSMIAQLVVAIALIGGAVFWLGACTIETGPGTTASTSPGGSDTSTSTTMAPGSITPGTIPGGGDSSGDSSNGWVSPAYSVAPQLGPSVVNIAIRGTQQGAFGQQQYSGEGSGVIYRADGMIITNNHVISDEAGNPVDRIDVTLVTGETLSATLVGRDPLTDLAVIKVESDKDLPAATFTDQLPAVGEYAIAIGSPLGYENSVTLGIISGLNRSIEGLTGAVGVALNALIQTDAPISPGNSGGALANADGQVIGINVAYLPPGQTGAVAIGFAIPSVVVTEVADEIIETGRVTHAYLGVGTQTVDADLQQQFGLSRSSGILVAEVTPNGPAARAGIQQGDIIISVDDRNMSLSSDLLVAIRDKKPGDVIQVTLDRGGSEQTIDITLEERPADL